MNFNDEATKPQADVTVNLFFNPYYKFCDIYKILFVTSQFFKKCES